MSTRLSREISKSVFFALFFTLAWSSGLRVMAQVPSTGSIVPIQVNPGAVNAMPANRDATENVAPPAEDVKLDSPEQPQQAEMSNEKFKVTSITLEGSTLLKEEEYRPLLIQYEGQDVSLNDLSALVEKLNALYRQKGYLTAQIYIPPQDIQGGAVKLLAAEGKIGNIEISGNRFFRTKAVLRNLPQKEGELLNVKDLEKSLNRINQADQFRLRATLTPGENPGETDIKLDVAERQPWQITPTFDNQGRPFIGTFRWGTEISNNNLFGVGDRLFTKWFMGARHTGVGANYALPINRFGTELGVNFGFNRVDPNIPVTDPQPNIIGSAYTYGISLAQPLDRERNWVADVGFNAKRISTFINDERAQPNGRDDIRSIQTGLTYNNVDRLGRTFARGQMTFAPNWMGADTSFWKAETFFTRLFRLPANNLILLRGYGQFTPDALVPAEMMQIGGAYSVRGYSEGLLLGDRGYQLNLEHRWPVPFLRNVSPWLADRVQGAFFVDFGQTFLDNSNRSRFVFSSNRNRTTLLGVGFGTRLRLTRFLQGFVDCGFGLLDNPFEPYGQPTARVHFGIRSDLLSDTYRTRAVEEDASKKAMVMTEEGDVKAQKAAEKAAKREAKLAAKAAAKAAKMQPAITAEEATPAADAVTPVLTQPVVPTTGEVMPVVDPAESQPVTP
jgi:hemolysin activation/secretion protein